MSVGLWFSSCNQITGSKLQTTDQQLEQSFQITGRVSQHLLVVNGASGFFVLRHDVYYNSVCVKRNEK